MAQGLGGKQTFHSLLDRIDRYGIHRSASGHMAMLAEAEAPHSTITGTEKPNAWDAAQVCQMQHTRIDTHKEVAQSNKTKRGFQIQPRTPKNAMLIWSAV